MYIQHWLSLRADTQVYLSWRLDRYNGPCLFFLPCSIQDRAIKEHSACRLDGFFFPAPLWQVRICSLAEKIGLNPIPTFHWMTSRQSAHTTHLDPALQLNSGLIIMLQITTYISSIGGCSIYSCLIRLLIDGCLFLKIEALCIYLNVKHKVEELTPTQRDKK